MAGRVIQVPMDETLCGVLDALARQRGLSRAEVIREACRRYLRDEEHRCAEARYIEGYQRIPEEPALGEAQATLVAAVLPAERW